MTRDIRDRLAMFTGEDIEVNRIALTMEQIRQYNPPPNPAKTTDARFGSYAEQFGDESWELDALDPDVLMELIRTAVTSYRNDRRWRQRVALEQEGRDRLTETSRRWTELTTYMTTNPIEEPDDDASEDTDGAGDGSEGDAD